MSTESDSAHSRRPQPGSSPVLKTLRKDNKARSRLPSRNRNAVQLQGHNLATGFETLKNWSASGRGSYTVQSDVSFTEEDNASNIQYTEDGSVKAASFAKLVEKLTLAGTQQVDVDVVATLFRVTSHSLKKTMLATSSTLRMVQ
eukprot:TRINITY_DN9769_c0_g1_i1.p1 TRINITY_DN9769_c0_g1~~TRINITY_DN9769_c0_g1_i1.p1  ORF type:complete len:144 (-),score=24.83 TRINITY_DN9769_c0_g1_i1:152-583(-)